jgi:putative addiction module killer protein
MYPIEYILDDRVQTTAEFRRWFGELRDPAAQRRIAARVARLGSGNHGDWKMIDRNLFELRLHLGPGYRVYYCRRRHVHVILLAGGDKWSQLRDIARARRLARHAEDLA